MVSPPNLREMIARLIETPSISSVNPEEDQSNRAVIELLAEWLSGLGFQAEIQDIAGAPGKANLIATLGRGEGGLVLAGHTDTVPYDENRWQSDPFRLSERDGKLYGLDTSDMKAFMALIVEAVRGLQAKDMAQPLVVLATADEESGMMGAQALVDAGRPLGRHAIIGEPTGLVPIRMHKGVMMESIRVIGRSGHSSDPSLGLNALEGMSRVLNALQIWRDQLQQRYRNDQFKIPMPTLNLGRICGGDNPNRICPEVELQIDIRPLPGMSLQELRHELEVQVRHALSDQPWQVELKPLFPGVEPMETAADAPLVRAAERLTGASAEAAAFGTEGPFLQQLGADVVVLGPGDIAQAHQPDEFIRLDRLTPTVTLLQDMIEHFCLTPAEPGAWAAHQEQPR
jgi:acetylornithine deacetylase